MKRREFCKTVAATGLVVGGAPLYLKRGPSEEKSGPVSIGWSPSFCIECDNFCPMDVKVYNGRAVEIKGDSSSVSNGLLCSFAVNALQDLYDPNRIQGPLMRAEREKGLSKDPQWMPISWGQAFSMVREKMEECQTREEISLIKGASNPLSFEIAFDKFSSAYHIENALSYRDLASERVSVGYFMGDGSLQRDLDLEKAEYILLFGVDINEKAWSSKDLFRSWRAIRSRDSSAKVVVVGSQYSILSSKANEWISIEPGSEGALAIAMAHVILTEGLWSRDFVGDFAQNTDFFASGRALSEDSFVEKSTRGLIEWWNHVVKDFTPSRAAQELNISEDTIYHLAEELANHRPAVAIAGEEVGRYSHGIYSTYAIYALNGLIGSIDAPGGYIYPQVAGFSSTNTELGFIKEGLLSGQERGDIFTHGFSKTRVLLDGDSSFQRERISGDMAYWNHLAEIPFVVLFSPIHSPKSQLADLILPVSHYLESWMYTCYLGASPEIRWARPAVLPHLDTRPIAEILMELAVGQGAAQDDVASFVRENLLPKDTSETGVVACKPYRSRDLEERSSQKAFSFFLHSQAFLQSSSKTSLLSSLPHYETPLWLQQKDGYLFTQRAPILPTFHQERGPSLEVEIHPLCAEKHHLATGDHARLFTAEDEIIAQVKVSELVNPSLIVMAQSDYYSQERCSKIMDTMVQIQRA